MMYNILVTNLEALSTEARTLLANGIGYGNDLAYN